MIFIFRWSHVKYRYVFPIFIKFGFYLQILIQFANGKLHINTSSWGLVEAVGQTEECMEIMRLIGTSHDFMNVPKNCSIRVSSKGITFTLSFLKIHRLAQTVKHAVQWKHTTQWLQSILVFLFRKKSTLKEYDQSYKLPRICLTCQLELRHLYRWEKRQPHLKCLPPTMNQLHQEWDSHSELSVPYRHLPHQHQ